jgi:hypothetical protein
MQSRPRHPMLAKVAYTIGGMAYKNRSLGLSGQEHALAELVEYTLHSSLSFQARSADYFLMLLRLKYQ